MRSHVLALLAILLLLGLTACPPPKKPGPVNTPGQTTPSPTATPVEYRFPLPSKPMTLDPAHITDSVSDAVARRIFNQLVRFDTEGQVINDLAEWYDISPDGKEYKFKLREDVEFHNGKPVKAADVVYSMQRLLDLATNSERANLLYYVNGARDFHDGQTADVPGLQIIDDYTLKIVLDQPYAPFIKVLCMTVFGVVEREAVEKDPTQFGSAPVGTGPFVFAEWDRSQGRITLKANHAYFLEEPKIQTVIFRVISDENTRIESFKTGALEHCDLLPSQIDSVRKDPNLSALVQGRAAMDMYCLGFNCEQPPFKDNTALRQALNYAVDKDNIINNIWGGLVTLQKTYVPEGMSYFRQDSPGYPYDVEKAKQLLDQAGYPGGKGLPELVLHISEQAINKLVAQAVQEDLRKVGVAVRIEVMEWGTFLPKIYDGESLFFQNTWVADYPDPDNWLYQLLHTENFGDAGNICRWSNSEFDHLVTQAQVVQDEAQRNELYRKAEEIVYNEAPWLLLFWKNNSTLVQPYVKGLTITAMDRSPQLNNATLEQVYFEREAE